MGTLKAVEAGLGVEQGYITSATVRSFLVMPFSNRLARSRSHKAVCLDGTSLSFFV